MNKAETTCLLETIFGGYAASATVSTPLPPSIPDEVTNKPRKRRTLGKGQPLAQEAPASFPFATESAEAVWEIAQQIVGLYPTEGPYEVIRIAMEKAGIEVQDLTPEDIQMLQLAVFYAQNGPVKNNVRIGGTPGGPFNSSGISGLGL